MLWQASVCVRLVALCVVGGGGIGEVWGRWGVECTCRLCCCELDFSCLLCPYNVFHSTAKFCSSPAPSRLCVLWHSCCTNCCTASKLSRSGQAADTSVSAPQLLALRFSWTPVLLFSAAPFSYLTLV